MVLVDFISSLPLDAIRVWWVWRVFLLENLIAKEGGKQAVQRVQRVLYVLFFQELSCIAKFVLYLKDFSCIVLYFQKIRKY